MIFDFWNHLKGFIIAPTNSISLLLHADGKLGLSNDQRFMIRLSVTRDPAYFLATDGSAIFDGRVKGSLAPPPRVLANQSSKLNAPFTSRDTPSIHPGRTAGPSGSARQNIFPARGTTDRQTLFTPKQNNQLSITSVHRQNPDRPYGPAEPDNDLNLASESEKYKIVNYQEDILFEEVCSSFCIDPLFFLIH